MRYPGHCNLMKLLLNDLRLRDRRDLLKDIFETAIPTTEQDVIVILASASGRHGRLEEESYPIRVFGADVDGHRLSAIQLSTAAGICAALDLVTQGALPQRGFVGQEMIALENLLQNRFGRVYAGKPLALDSAVIERPLTSSVTTFAGGCNPAPANAASQRNPSRADLAQPSSRRVARTGAALPARCPPGSGARCPRARRRRRACSG